jgi:hypothetical protein
MDLMSEIKTILATLHPELNEYNERDHFLLK